MTLNFGSTTIALTGWMIDPQKPEIERDRRLQAIRKLVNEYHLQAVELTLDLSLLYPDVFDQGFYQQVAYLQHELGFMCSVHLPFIWLDCSSLNEKIRVASVQSILKAIEIASPLQVSSYVAHLWGITSMNIMRLGIRESNDTSIKKVMRKQAIKSLQTLTEAVGANKLCVETLEFPDFEFIAPVVQDAGAGICLDVGHTVYASQTPVEFFHHYRKSICEVHLHDATREKTNGRVKTQSHLPLGDGDAPIATLLEQLYISNFQGTIILENNNQTDLESSLDYLNSFAKPITRKP